MDHRFTATACLIFVFATIQAMPTMSPISDIYDLQEAFDNIISDVSCGKNVTFACPNITEPLECITEQLKHGKNNCTDENEIIDSVLNLLKNFILTPPGRTSSSVCKLKSQNVQKSLADFKDGVDGFLQCLISERN